MITTHDLHKPELQGRSSEQTPGATHCNKFQSRALVLRVGRQSGGLSVALDTQRHPGLCPLGASPASQMSPEGQYRPQLRTLLLKVMVTIIPLLYRNLPQYFLCQN